MTRRRVVLDECLPAPLRHELGGFDVSTAQHAGLAGLKNGRLLAAIAGRFDVFVTIDGSLRYQQDLGGRLFGVVVIYARSNRMQDLVPLATALNAAIADVAVGQVVDVGKS